MVEIARAAQIPSIGPEYNNFLYATIGADANGTLFSVLSAMARMNLDPWQEAADLAELSAKAAVRRLAALIAAVPGGPSEPGEPGLIAARLVKLLPNQTRSILPVLPPHKDLLGVAAQAKSRIALYLLFVLIALALATMWFTPHQSTSALPSTVHVSGTTQSISDPTSISRT
jgi:hypothetical protein